MSDEKKHALLSASSSHRWLKCTPSARLEEQFEEETSDYAKEGTLAHEIAEFKVNNFIFETLSKRSYNAKLKKFEKEELYNPEMLTHTETYLEYIKGLMLESPIKPFSAIEQTVDYSTYAPEGFGTADFLMIRENTLTIVDFKYGKGVEVSAVENPQMKLYALGAYEQFKLFYDIKTVKMAIVQPRIDNISEYELPIMDLLNWGNTVVKPQAEKAFKGEGEFEEGEHCKFCRAKGKCRYRNETNLQKYEDARNTQIISNTELGQVLSKIEGLDTWLKDLKATALKEILQGHKVEGWKAVEGKSNRKIVDIDKAFEIIEAGGIERALLYETSPISLTELEKVVGKKKLGELIGDYIEKPKGAPTLAKESDKRKNYKESSALEDFRKRGKLI